MSVFRDVMSVAHAPIKAAMGDAVTHTPAAGGGPYTGVGVFDRAHEYEFEGSDGPVSTTGPALWIALGDWSPAPAQGDALIVSGVSETWRVDDVRPDGSGGATLILVV